MQKSPSPRYRECALMQNVDLSIVIAAFTRKRLPILNVSGLKMVTAYESEVAHFNASTRDDARH